LLPTFIPYFQLFNFSSSTISDLISMTLVAKIAIDPHAVCGNLSDANPEFLTFEANVAAIVTPGLASKGIGLEDIKVTKDHDPKKTPDRAQGDDLGQHNVTPPEKKQKFFEGDVNSDSERSTSDDENKKPSEVDFATKDAAEKKSPTSTEKPAADAECSLMIADGSNAKKSAEEEPPISDADNNKKPADKNEKPAAEAINTLAIPDGSDPKTSAGEETTVSNANEKEKPSVQADPKASKDPSNETPVPSANENENPSADADPKASKEDNFTGVWSKERNCFLFFDHGNNNNDGSDKPRHSWGGPQGADLMVCGSEESGEIPKAPKDTAAPESPSTGTTDKAGEVPKAPKDTAAPESPTAGTTDKAASDSDDNLSPPQTMRTDGNQACGYSEPIFVETVEVLHLVNGDTPGAVPLNSKEGRRMLCDGTKNVLLLKDKPEIQSTTPAEEDV